MTSIQNFPEELLLSVFSNLTKRDLNKCLYVCRSWYTPARIHFLKRVVLVNISRIRRFITAFNRNPDPRFLAAVKVILISPTKEFNITDKALVNIFCRFPNLETVVLNEVLLNKLNDALCRKILNSCPKMKTVTVQPNFLPPSNEEIVKARLLLTEIEIQRGTVGNVQDFVASFPRLESLIGSFWEATSDFNNFESLLPVFLRLSNLTKISFRKIGDDTDNFMENFLQTKTLQERNLLVERISRITDLYIGRDNTFILKGALKLICEYMTGVKHIRVDSALNPDELELCRTMLGLIQTINHCYFEWHVWIDRIWVNVVELMQQACQHSVQETKLHLFVWHSLLLGPKVLVETTQNIRVIQVQFRASELTHGRPFINSVLEMDTFELEFELPVRLKPGWIKQLDTFFRSKSTVKKVIFHVPLTVAEKEEIPLNDDISQNHTHVEELKILSPTSDPPQQLLDRCGAAFPNLKVLSFDGFCGFWQKDLSQYQLVLPKFTLEKLLVDIYLERRETQENPYIIVKVESLALGVKYLYKVPLNDDEPTRIDDQDIQNGKDKILLHVTVGSLKYLEIVRRGAEHKPNIIVEIK